MELPPELFHNIIYYIPEFKTIKIINMSTHNHIIKDEIQREFYKKSHKFAQSLFDKYFDKERYDIKYLKVDVFIDDIADILCDALNNFTIKMWNSKSDTKYLERMTGEILTCLFGGMRDDFFPLLYDLEKYYEISKKPVNKVLKLCKSTEIPNKLKDYLDMD